MIKIWGNIKSILNVLKLVLKSEKILILSVLSLRIIND